VTAILGATLHNEPLALDLDALIGSHMGIVANAGGGKSGLIRRLLEQTYGQIQHIVLDGEDESYTLRQRFDYVIAGGQGGDTEAKPANAGALAVAALTHGFSLICQLNDLGHGGAGEFVANFLEAMISAPQELWHPVLVVIDEAQRFDPDAIRMLTERGRKRGFTAVLASQRLPKIDANIRGDINNWLMGRVGQTLDRGIMADQLGMRKSDSRLMGTEPRQFWAFGPALAREPALFRVGDVETTMVRPGQAKVATPPAPEALREILAGLVAKSDPEAEICKSGSDYANPILAAELAALRAERDEWTIERAYGQRQIDALVTENRALHEIAARIGAAASDMGRIRPALEMFDETPAQGGGGPEETTGKTEGTLAAVPTPRATAPAPAARTATEKAGGGNASPAALAIAELLDRMNPARLTWSQAATMTGRKASGGNFNAARKWLRESGRILEDVDGQMIRSAKPDPEGLSRDAAINLWKGALTNPAPKMIVAFLARGLLTKDELGEAIGTAPRGGNFNNGLAQLRRNGLLVEHSGIFRLAEPLPGERP
jgi:hypothetical protein